MKCILCGGNKFDLLFKTHEFTLLKCRKCGLVRTKELPQVSYDEYHRDSDYQKFENLFKNIFQKRVNIVYKYKQSGRILDIGASTGTMLSIFKKDGWEVYGVEPSGSGEVAEEKGIKIYKTVFEKAKIPKNYFDAVILNHTLEHVDDPLKVLKKVKTILKKGGIVLVDVPDFGGLTSQILKGRWPYLVPNEHTYHFTKITLSKIFEKVGFEIIYTESRAGLFEFASPMGEILESLRTLKKRFFKNLLYFPYDAFTTLIGRGNSLTIAGKKDK